MADFFAPIEENTMECKDGFCELPSPKKVVIDEVNQPAHYISSGMEAIQVMEAFLSAEEFEGYLRGNALKYLLRLKGKGSAKMNAEKCMWYVNRLSKELG